MGILIKFPSQETSKSKSEATREVDNCLSVAHYHTAKLLIFTGVRYERLNSQANAISNKNNKLIV